MLQTLNLIFLDRQEIDLFYGCYNVWGSPLPLPIQSLVHRNAATNKDSVESKRIRPYYECLLTEALARRVVNAWLKCTHYGICRVLWFRSQYLSPYPHD
jgi:hypothetical protein